MISVAMASYNGEKYILEQLHSIWNQTLQPDEIIISDDASTDKTVELIELFIKNTGAPVKLIKNNKNNGYIKNFFNSLSNVSGDLVFLSDQDDIWHKEKIQRCVALLRKNPYIAALSTNFALINRNGVIIKTPFQFPYFRHLKKISARKFLRYPKLPGMAMVAKREIIIEVLSQKNYSAAHDWQLNLQAALQGRLYYYPVNLTFYRQHAQNTVGACLTKGAKQRIYMLEGLRRNLEDLKILPSEMQYISNLKKTIEKRIELVKYKKAGTLLIYNFLHLKYLSFYSLLGDLYAVIHWGR